MGKSVRLRCGGPSEGMETCPQCKKEFRCYRSGSNDWEPKNCFKCSSGNLVKKMEANGSMDKLKEAAKEWVHPSDERANKFNGSCEYCGVVNPYHSPGCSYSVAENLGTLHPLTAKVVKAESARLCSRINALEKAMEIKAADHDRKVDALVLELKEANARALAQFDAAAKLRKELSEMEAHFKGISTPKKPRLIKNLLQREISYWKTMVAFGRKNTLNEAIEVATDHSKNCGACGCDGAQIAHELMALRDKTQVAQDG